MIVFELLGMIVLLAFVTYAGIVVVVFMIVAPLWEWGWRAYDRWQARRRPQGMSEIEWIEKRLSDRW